jgi:hypothetical protein
MNKPNLPNQSNILFESTRRINIKDIAQDTTETEYKKIRRRRMKISASLAVLMVCLTTYLFIQSRPQDVTAEIGNIDIHLALPHVGSQAPTTHNNEAFGGQGSPSGQMMGEQQPQQVQDYSDRYSRYEEETYYANAVDTEDTEARSPASVSSEEFVEVQESEPVIETPTEGEF